MANPAYNLAIETSSRQGAIALGHGDQMLCAVDLPTPRRHRVDLLPAIAKLCDQYQIKPADIGEIYISIGPGSFTGLRIAVTTAKVISLITGAKLVAVPTIDAVAQSAPPSDDILAVAINQKHQTVYGGLYQHDGKRWTPISKPQVQTLKQLLTPGTPRSFPWSQVTLGPSPMLSPRGAKRGISPPGSPGSPGSQSPFSGKQKIKLFPPPEPPQAPEATELLKTLPEHQKVYPNFRGGQAQAVWQIGQRLASDLQYTDAYALVPLYAREPEAVKLWEQNKNKRVTCS